jgi:hypothetical protein
MKRNTSKYFQIALFATLKFWGNESVSINLTRINIFLHFYNTKERKMLNRYFKNNQLLHFGFCVILLFMFLSSCTKDENSQNDNDEALANNKKIARAVVHCSAVGLGNTLSLFADSAQKVEFIRQYIDSIRFYEDSSGYFYVYNFSCVNIAHATQKDLEGQNLYDYQDSHGNYVIRELSAAAQRGGDFVEYYWIKPGSTGEHLKIGYVEPIKNTDFFIGTGVYIPE